MLDQLDDRELRRIQNIGSLHQSEMKGGVGANKFDQKDDDVSATRCL